MASKGKCVAKRCKNCPRSRGLCNTCYHTAWLLVRSGKETWGTLERKGLALPLRVNPFIDALESSNK